MGDDMKPALTIAVSFTLAGLIGIGGAVAQDFVCKDRGRCFCMVSTPAYAAFASPDRVAITCINADTESVAYYYVAQKEWKAAAARQ